MPVGFHSFSSFCLFTTGTQVLLNFDSAILLRIALCKVRVKEVVVDSHMRLLPMHGLIDQ